MLSISILSLILTIQSPQDYLIEPSTDVTATVQEDGRYALKWKDPSPSVSIYRSDRADRFLGRPVALVKGANSVLVDGFTDHKRPYFKLAFSDGKTLLVADRFLHFTKADNFRDLGGYSTTDGHHTKWGVIYRSNSLHDVTDAEKEVLTNQLKIEEVFDVRGDSEVKQSPDNLPPLTYTRLPIAAEGMMAVKVTPKPGKSYGEALLEAGYIQAVDTHGADVFGPWLKTLAEKPDRSTPSVLHCTAGKDRTGVAYAILLSLLGVPRETVIADYSLTNLTYDSLARSFERSGYPASYKALLLAYPNAIAATVDHIDARYGSVKKYAESIGVNEADVKRLRQRLLD